MYKHCIMTDVGISPSEIVEASPKKQGEKTVFLVAGRLVYLKGHQFLFDALKSIPDIYQYECRIVGNGPDMEFLRKICSENERLKKNVKFLGAKPYCEMEKEYLNADVLIMPSLRETTGTVLLEAISKGVPVITLRKFGAAVILNDETAWLLDGTTEEEYVNALSDAIIDCITNPDKVAQKGEKARLKAMELVWSKKGEQYQEIYEQLVKGK